VGGTAPCSTPTEHAKVQPTRSAAASPLRLSEMDQPGDPPGTRQEASEFPCTAGRWPGTSLSGLGCSCSPLAVLTLLGGIRASTASDAGSGPGVTAQWAYAR
jgi:hypothetical protein